ncbi:urease accessory protein UreH domain-containing protein [Riemerella columbina]|uniref:urease accessory protein UreH domain-containing protein n=1 Tax=Riemerella columbina TaxID=103810 RepID=UPI00266EE113|nr:sulfite exporter TauE/SafE family protein [Riemerella columbina]WKS95097.1 sulfite exporter TauE/SafE family protein [Riemerella columbina]
MDTTLWALVITAVSISFIYTASGPDHYLLLIVLSRSKQWSQSKTIFWVVLCGFGHILSSVILGLIGVFLGWQLDKISWFQGIQGHFSGWVLLIFGVGYLLYAIVQAYRNKPHKHFDVMGEDIYVYEHNHGEMVMPQNRVKVTPLVLFAIFVMGPSEPLIPLLFYSGTKHSVTEIIVLITAFTLTTVLTILVMGLLGRYGYTLVQSDKIERYMNVISGAVVTLCGIGVLFLDW